MTHIWDAAVPTAYQSQNVGATAPYERLADT